MKRKNPKNILVPIFLVLTLNSTFKVLSQNTDSILICKYPVKEGYVYILKHEKPTSYQDPITYLPIFSKDSSVFAFKGGKVVTVYQKENFIVIRSGKKYISYSNFQKIIVNVGDKISRGQLLGFTKKTSTDEYFRLDFKMNNSEKDISYEDQLKYLKRACSH